MSFKSTQDCLEKLSGLSRLNLFKSTLGLNIDFVAHNFDFIVALYEELRSMPHQLLTPKGCYTWITLCFAL